MAAHLNRVRLRRLLAAAGLVGVVVAGHLEGVGRLAAYARAFSDAQMAPPRMTVVYVREMTLTEPVQRVVAATTPKRTPAHRRVARAAVAPDPVASAALAASAVEPEADSTALARAEPAVAPAPAPTPTPGSAEAADAQPVSPPASATSGEVATPFEWPVSTRLRYDLGGDYRGEVHGHAQVEWIKSGAHYQVHLDIEVGLLAWRRMSSDGEITATGLAPRRYDQETQIAFGDPHRHTMRFDDERIWLATGEVLPRWPGVQDTVSQFVQLAWLFDSQPQRLRVGERVEMPLAMPRKVSVWVYDVVKEETLYTHFGQIRAFHLKPRREPRAGGDMTVDIWIAPQLRHLPVKFRIRPDPEAYFDLMLDRRPELAVAEPSPGAGARQ